MAEYEAKRDFHPAPRESAHCLPEAQLMDMETRAYTERLCGKYAARTDSCHRVHTVADMLSVKMGGFTRKRKCQLRSGWG